MKKDKAKWIDDVLAASDDLHPVEIPKALVDSLKKIPAKYAIQHQQVSWNFLWMAAAGILLLLTLNIKTLIEHHKTIETNTSFYSSYYSYLDPLQ
jgi:hypothetical protein